MRFDRRSLLITAGLTGTALAASRFAPKAYGKGTDVSTPRPLDPSFDLSSVVIVAPEIDAWKALGDELAAAIEAKGHPRPAVTAPTDEAFAEGWAGNTIVLGHLGNNTQMARLYGMRYAMVDSWFPGEGAHWLLTLVDPFGLGGNTLVVGAGDLSGAQAGVTALIGLLDDELGRVHLAKLDDAVLGALINKGVADEAFVTTSLAEIDQQLAALVPSTGVEADAVRLHSVLSRITVFGQAHLLTADPGFLTLYRHILLGYAKFLADHPTESTDQLNNSRNMWGSGEELISLWAALEPASAFNDADRTAVLAALHHTFAANADDSYLTGARPEAPRWNHEAYPALSLVAGADYFLRHHDLPVAQEWMDLGRRIFTGNTAVISLDEGADYLMHLPMITMDYAMFAGELQYMQQSLRPSADLQALMTDNIGQLAGGGDVYPYGHSGLYSWGHSQVLHAATWLYGDPMYKLLLDRARTGPLADQRMTDLAMPLHRYIVEAESDGTPPAEVSRPGVMAYPIEPGVYDDLDAETPIEIPRERTFHKLAFRSGLDIDDATLMLDGFAAGRHNHFDNNAIIEWTAQQRLLLTDRDYMESAPEHHSALVVVRNGEQVMPGPFSEVAWVADVDSLSVSRTGVLDTNGVNWWRTVLTVDGSFHVVLDEVDFIADGSYLLKNQWQTLGQGELAGARYRGRQEGVVMTIDSADDSLLRLEDRYGHFTKYFKSEYPYPFADAETVLSQVVTEGPRKVGDEAVFVNVLAAAAGEDTSVNPRRTSDTLWHVRHSGQEWTFVRGPVDTDGLVSDGALHVTGPDATTILGTTEVVLAGATHSFDEPVIMVVEHASGDWAAFGGRRDLVAYDEHGEPVRPGPVAEGTSDWRGTTAREFVADVRRSSRQQPRTQKVAPAVTQVPAGWVTTDSVAGTVTTCTQAELGAASVLLVGTTDGHVSAVDAAGAVQWTAQVTGRVNEITVHDLGAGPQIFVATEGWHVHALDADGTEVWRREIPNDAARRERKGNLLGVTIVRAAHVNGKDQPPCLMVGTQFRWMYTLAASGEIRHEVMLTWYGIEDAVFADFDGDGKDEGAVALEYFYPTFWKGGKEVRGGIGGGPGFTRTALVEAASGSPSVVFGTKINEVRSLSLSAGKVVSGWRRNVGGEVRALVSGAFHDQVGQEILVGTTGFHVHSLGADGATRFRTAVGDTVRSILAEPGAGYLVGVDHGTLVVLDTEGAETERWQFEADVVGVAQTDGTRWVVLRNGTIARTS
ncbi:hypothetical protein ACQCX2_04450 [Propionibacteriaceae bacterium Y1700]|uniref:hypothetical protein n=1 Tax=Microlunatus sp. Y1700 TaxID=3418487 RepID=UPI003DA7A5B4